MGDRAMAQIITKDGKVEGSIYVYTHHGGYDLGI